MKSRTYRTCENILKSLVKQYGPMARVGSPLIKKMIEEVAGGDPRTVKRYWGTLLKFEFVMDCHEGGAYGFNWKKLDYQQLNFQECLIMNEDDEPP